MDSKCHFLSSLSHSPITCWKFSYFPTVMHSWLKNSKRLNDIFSVIFAIVHSGPNYSQQYLTKLISIVIAWGCLLWSHSNRDTDSCSSANTSSLLATEIHVLSLSIIWWKHVYTVKIPGMLHGLKWKSLLSHLMDNALLVHEFNIIFISMCTGQQVNKVIKYFSLSSYMWSDWH